MKKCISENSLQAVYNQDKEQTAPTLTYFLIFIF